MRLRPTIAGTALALAVGLGAAACSDSDDGATSTTTEPGATTVTTQPGTTAPSSTTASTTTTPAETTTTVTTTTAPATTATTVAGAGDTVQPGTGLTLTHVGIGPLVFGATVAASDEFLRAGLGVPVTDSGWGDSFSVYGTCPGSEVRGLEWPGVTMLFGDADDEYSSGGRHFMSWIISEPDLFGLTTREGIGIGDSRAAVIAAYPDAEFFDADEPFPAGFRHTVGAHQLYGTFTDEGRLMWLTAGTACGE